MKVMKKFISLVITITMLSCFATVVHADPQNTQYSSLHVNAGASQFTSTTSATTERRYKCYMRLRGFKFLYYPQNSMPSGYYIYSRLYSYTKETKVSNLASFSGVTSVGNYNYTYISGYGAIAAMYYLKTNSSYSMTEYYADFDWSANPY